MATEDKAAESWEKAECPETFDRECFPPLGISRLLPHHFLLWPHPTPHTCSCCCCGHSHVTVPEKGCGIDLFLEPNTFGPGKSIHVLVVGYPYQYYAEFYLDWTATGSGQVTVSLELVSGPAGAPSLLASNRGPSDRFLFSTYTPGSYLFRVTMTDSQGKRCFDTLQVDVPAV